VREVGAVGDASPHAVLGQDYPNDVGITAVSEPLQGCQQWPGAGLPEIDLRRMHHQTQKIQILNTLTNPLLVHPEQIGDLCNTHLRCRDPETGLLRQPFIIGRHRIERCGQARMSADVFALGCRQIRLSRRSGVIVRTHTTPQEFAVMASRIPPLTIIIVAPEKITMDAFAESSASGRDGCQR